MTRTFQLLVLALAASVSLTILAGCDEPPKPPELKIRIFVDGRDLIKVTGNKLWIEHESFNVPDRPVRVNGDSWVPKWTENKTDVYEQVDPAFKPADTKMAKLTQITGRGTAAIVEPPAAANNQTMAIRVDDTDADGADWYEFVVTW